jgi:hypothetical protein
MGYTDREFERVKNEAGYYKDSGFSICTMFKWNPVLRFLGTDKVKEIMQKLVEDRMLNLEDKHGIAMYRGNFLKNYPFIRLLEGDTEVSCLNCTQPNHDGEYAGSCGAFKKYFHHVSNKIPNDGMMDGNMIAQFCPDYGLHGKTSV